MRFMSKIIIKERLMYWLERETWSFAFDSHQKREEDTFLWVARAVISGLELTYNC